MASLNMKGPYTFTREEIEKRVTKKSPGNYALGYSKDGFVPKYVGRSDTDVAAELKAWLTLANKYSQFKYSYASSSKAAFEKECHNYHDFKDQLDNKYHPDRPDGKN